MINDSTYRKIYFTINIAFIITFISFFVVKEILVFPEGIPSFLPDVIFILIIGLILSLASFSMTVAAWTREADEYLALVLSISIFNWQKKWIVKRSEGYWLWNGRIGGILGILIGTILTMVGVVNIVRIY